MRLSEALTVERVCLDLRGPDKDSVIRALVECAAHHGPIADRELCVLRVLEREHMLSTGLGHGVAVPHAQAEGVQGVLCCLGIVPDGVDFDAVDEEPAHVVCLIAAQEGLDGPYLQLLSHISRLFARGDVRQRLLRAESPAQALDVIREVEAHLRADDYGA
jgi:mannitol/fructose-specific phosphotransferase system IIA component (Ntr-type)